MHRASPRFCNLPSGRLFSRISKSRMKRGWSQNWPPYKISQDD